MIDTKVSLNGNLILKPYLKTKQLETKEIATGFVATSAKILVEPLELLIDAAISIGGKTEILEKGSLVYFKQESLFVQDWAKRVFESEAIGEKFIVGNIADAVLIESK